MDSCIRMPICMLLLSFKENGIWMKICGQETGVQTAAGKTERKACRRVGKAERDRLGVAKWALLLRFDWASNTMGW